jgi:hypothetical protein
MENPATTTSNRTTGKLSLSALPGIRQQMEQILYRFYDAKDNLLYVGISNHFYARASEHTKNSGWMKNAVRATFEHYADRQSVLSAERSAIINEAPLFNKKHNLDNLGVGDHFADIANGLIADDFHNVLMDNWNLAMVLANEITNEPPTKNSKIWSMSVALREQNLAEFEQCQVCLFIMNSDEFKEQELGFWFRMKGAFKKGKKCR